MKTKTIHFSTLLVTTFLFTVHFSSWIFGQTVNVFTVPGGGSFPSSWSGANAIIADPIDKTDYYLVEAGDPSDRITTATYDLSYFSSVTFSISVATFGGHITFNRAKIEISYDGGISYTETLFSSLPVNSTDYLSAVFTLSSVSSQVKLKISNEGTTGRGVRLKNLQLDGVGNTCTSTALITSFSPTAAPSSSQVQITGTGFTGASAVQFGSVNASSFTVVNATTILATVPVGMDSNIPIFVSDASSCPIISLSNFTLTKSGGSCAYYTGYSDLFISEIYDSHIDNVWNIELFNPTSNPIVLTGVYQIKRSEDFSTPITYTRTIDLTGTVPPNSTFLIEAGNSPQACSSIAYDMSENDVGINENDLVALFKNGSLVDVTQAPNELGYSIWRNVANGITAPSDIFVSADWTVNLMESCSDLGVFSLPIEVPEITSSPGDLITCQLNMSIATPTSDLTYLWKYNHPNNMTNWLDVNSSNLPLVNISGEATDNLTIEGLTSSVSGYQFYCQITKNGCTVLSNAAQFKAESRSIYRTTFSANGNWSDYSKWEMSDDYVNYVPACSYPNSNNTSEIILDFNSYLVLDLSGSNAISVNRLTIQENATLEMLPSAKLSVVDGVSGADLIVNGTLFDRNSTTNGIGFDASATWQLGPNGTVIKSNYAAISPYKEKYEGGMSSIPASANWIFRNNGDGNPRIGTVDFFYPNLFFENTTASQYAWENPTAGTAFTGSAGFATVKGNLNIGLTGTAPCLVSNVNTNAQAMLILGDLNIGTGSSLSNRTASAFGTGFELKGNLVADGTLHVLDGNLERVFRFTGLSDQTISGNGNIDLFKMTIDKPAGQILLNRNLNVQNELLMTQGNILTNTHCLELGISISQKGILNHTSGLVVGKMRRWLDGTNAGNASGLFPMGFEDLLIGTGIKNRNVRIEFTNAATDGGHLTVEYIGSPMGFAGLPILTANSGNAGFDIVTTEDQGYWKIDNEAGKLLDGKYTITCTGEGYETITDLDKLTLIKRVGTGGWHCPGSHIAAVPTTPTLPIVARLDVSGWSNFGFGGGTGNPLPIQLIDFHASCSENQINIKWSTASELNTNHFVVEKSRDLADWAFVSQVAAAGNSVQEKHYFAVDLEDVTGTFYYRLKQINFNGQEEIHGPISASCENEKISIAVYPNPASPDFTIEIPWDNPPTQALLQIRDVCGKVVHETSVNLKMGINHKLTYQPKNWQTGIYWIQLNHQGQTHSTPVRLLITN